MRRVFTSFVFYTNDVHRPWDNGFAQCVICRQDRRNEPCRHRPAVPAFFYGAIRLITGRRTNDGSRWRPRAGQNNRATTKHHPCVLNASLLECRVQCGRHQHYLACRRPRSRPALEPDTEIRGRAMFAKIGLWRGSCECVQPRPNTSTPNRKAMARIPNKKASCLLVGRPLARVMSNHTS
jgi:hypothetical protein